MANGDDPYRLATRRLGRGPTGPLRPVVALRHALGLVLAAAALGVLSKAGVEVSAWEIVGIPLNGEKVSPVDLAAEFGEPLGNVAYT
jgi:hypothetical protein